MADTAHYDSTYGHFADRVAAEIRREAFGEDIGQNSWLTADELRKFAHWLGIGAASDVLDVASGSGGPAMFVARESGCRVTGIDLHEGGVVTANAKAAEQSLDDRVRFVHVDVRNPLPFPDGTFAAVICIDSWNHLYERRRVLEEWFRVVRAGGRIVFTDPITVTGPLRREEMIVRSAGMGDFVFTPLGEDERLVAAAGFRVLRIEDVTENVVAVASAWHAARARRTADLDRLEGAEHNASYQQFLNTVATLAREKRLSRYAYLAERP